MRILSSIAAAALCTQLSGCFAFFWIPGSVVQKASDLVTGARGENCVRSDIKVGDRITLTSGESVVVKSLSGTSGRCTDPHFPIRAEVQS